MGELCEYIVVPTINSEKVAKEGGANVEGKMKSGLDFGYLGGDIHHAVIYVRLKLREHMSAD